MSKGSKWFTGDTSAQAEAKADAWLEIHPNAQPQSISTRQMDGVWTASLHYLDDSDDTVEISEQPADFAPPAPQIAQKQWMTAAAILAGAVLIAGSILFVGRWQISAIGFGYGGSEGTSDTDTQAVYRLDRWTGTVDYCLGTNMTSEGTIEIDCPAKLPPPSRPNSN